MYTTKWHFASAEIWTRASPPHDHLLLNYKSFLHGLVKKHDIVAKCDIQELSLKRRIKSPSMLASELNPL